MRQNCMSDFKKVEEPAVDSQEAVAAEKDLGKCVIRIVGVGGGGCNCVQHMVDEKVNGVEFIAVNTDMKALSESRVPVKVQIGVQQTHGLGSGCNPDIGRKAAEESKEALKNLLQGSEMVFITAGMGGGTGTGASPVIAALARECGALTVAVVTKPFNFEGKRHMKNALAGIEELSKQVDSIIVIENRKLASFMGNVSAKNCFAAADDVLLKAVRGITDSINVAGYINVDFADVRTMMTGSGRAWIGMGTGHGTNAVADAMQEAIHCPLTDQVDIKSAAGILAVIRVNPNLPMSKLDELGDEIQTYADEDSEFKFGLSFDDKLAEDEISVTVLIAGILSPEELEKRAAEQAQAQPQGTPAEQGVPAASAAGVAPAQPFGQAAAMQAAPAAALNAGAGGFFSLSQQSRPAPMYQQAQGVQPQSQVQPQLQPQGAVFGGVMQAGGSASVQPGQPAQAFGTMAQEPLSQANTAVKQPEDDQAGVNTWDLPLFLRSKSE